MAENSTNSKVWRLNRQLSVSALVQIVLLASLIVGSWVNLQRQLDLLQKDVSQILSCQERFSERIEKLSAKAIEHEYRLRAVEKTCSKVRFENESVEEF